MDMITTVIRNLINNALKYTRENDTILVSVQELENKLEVSVEDSGIGMRQST
ncbi:MAG: sensor histidine kinase [Leptospiraceae bacterium]|nr:sensor histidine kinase [Leptospiraceae bacterium]